MKKLDARRAGALAAAALATALVAALLVAPVAGAAPDTVAPLVSTAKNADLGKTVLVNRKGLTLYSLSVERHGKFICTDSECLSFWTPLTVKKGAKPNGIAGLATVKRPDGRTQVTYHGRPLYTFYLDHARGDDGGEGFKDVGIWHAAAAKRAA
jgi:predicted lipoprotein with Yx(FWY)xxD motif